MTSLKILAGPKAFRHIQQQGLSPQDITAVFGASGAAKWLTIVGLDVTIFGQWLSASTQPIDLFGTSVGAFKLAAAAQQNPVAAMNTLADAYIDQHYTGKVTPAQIALATEKIFAAFLSNSNIDEILCNQRYNFHCASVKCKGLLASDNTPLQIAAMAKALLLSFTGRNAHQSIFERVVFSAGSPVNTFCGADAYTTEQVGLNKHNFRAALLSSGSIPLHMPGIRNIADAPAGTYRDGGLLDYHPVPSNVATIDNGLVLYPHFYTHLKEGWFDKFSRGRKVSSQQLDNTVLIGPSDDYVRLLPGASIPDRRDFSRYMDNEPERIRRWTEAKTRSFELGEDFMQLVQSGDIAKQVVLI
ncbi:MAG: hypothetical protein ACI9WS_003195 [Paraglaciecola psychrophila]|jgi:hypothetical protein